LKSTALVFNMRAIKVELSLAALRMGLAEMGYVEAVL
jgi:hypothetical protein